jgi:hypothetical protein
MNSKERERWLKLIRSQFADKRDKLREIGRNEEIENWVAAKISSMKLTPKLNKIKAAKAAVQKLEQTLAVEVKNHLGIEVDDDSCGCHESVEFILNQYGSKQLAKLRSERHEALGKDERHLLAQVELAETSEDIAKIAKKAGLL